jgi:hypothetical protein
MSKQSHRNISTLHGFPLGRAGEYSLELKLKDIRDDTKVLVEASYPLFVIYDAKLPATA